ncbi:hypothetical protein [Streptomyces sp. IB201691-2A2]|nr:hypothetical protein [Streptomyces sp. IB201691-2A2]
MLTRTATPDVTGSVAVLKKLNDGKPGGWHKADASFCNNWGAACIPHAAI